MDKQDIIYDLVKDIKADQDCMKTDVFDIKSDIRIHATSLERYNDLLNTHIEGVNTLKKLHLDNAKRIQLLEEPMKIQIAIQQHHKSLVKQTAKIVGVIATLIGIIMTIKGWK